MYTSRPRYRKRFVPRRFPFTGSRIFGASPRPRPRIQPRLPLYMSPARRTSTKEIKAYDGDDYSPYLGTLLEIGAPPVYAGVGWAALNLVEEGPAGYQRVGSRALFTSVEVEMVLNGLTASTVGTVRYMIVVDKQPNGAAFTIGELLQDNIAGGLTFQSGMNMASKNRFQIMRDAYVTIDAASGLVKHEKCFVKCRVPSDYVGTTAAIGSITSGAIHLIVFAENISAGVGDKIELHTLRARVRYED